MALFKTGSLLFRTFNLTAVNPLFVIPSTVNVQSRNAARKGYREKARLKAKANKKEAVKKPVTTGIQKKQVKYEKSVESTKPDPPNDDIIIMDNFKTMKYTISDAVKFHREYHHPTVFDNPEAYLFLDVEINMVGKKQTQVMKPFTGIAPLPHPFVYKLKKEILVFCEDKYREIALQSGASMAGAQELVKKVQGGVIHTSVFDYVICHVNFLHELTPIRGLLKNQLPRISVGTLTGDLKSAIYKFLHGVEYSCVKYGPTEDFGVIQIPFGTIDMELEHLENNFKAVLEVINTHKPPRDGDFITWVWCRSPPSNEKFCIDLSKYVESGQSKTEVVDDDDDDDEEVMSEKKKEKLRIQELQEKLEEEKVVSEKV